MDSNLLTISQRVAMTAPPHIVFQRRRQTAFNRVVRHVPQLLFEFRAIPHDAVPGFVLLERTAGLASQVNSPGRNTFDPLQNAGQRNAWQWS